MRKLVVLALTLTGALMAAAPAMAEGETVQVTSVTCSGVTVEGGGYTEGQDLTVVAKAPNGEGAITDLVTVAAGNQGSLGPVTLKFGGQVPDGTYIVEVSTPGPGQRETVTDEFTIKGCGPGGGLPFTGSAHACSPNHWRRSPCCRNDLGPTGATELTTAAVNFKGSQPHHQPPRRFFSHNGGLRPT